MSDSKKEVTFGESLKRDMKYIKTEEDGSIVMEGFQKQKIGQVVKEEINIEDFLIIKYNDDGEEVSRKVNIDAVADYLISKYKIVTWFGTNSDYSFNWNGKIFKNDSRGLIKVQAEKVLNEYCKRNVVEEIFEKVKRKTKINRETFEKNDEYLIPLENGIWDIKHKKLIPHDPKYNFQFIIPQVYDKEATCPNWINFINETLYLDDVLVMQEWFGFNLFREYFIKKGVICEGEQNTGKSVLLDTLIKFIGDSNKTGLSLQKITGGSDFTKLSLKNKHSNIYDDLSSKDLSDGGAFKVATGGGWISGEEKFGEYTQFRSFAKQMFATNKIPPVKDNDDIAYFGRWIVFKFDNVPEKLDPFLRKKLWTEEEMSGILNWALEGLYRLLDKGGFSYKKTPIEIKQIMEESGCPLISFVVDVLEKDDGKIITKEKMYQVYSRWCEKKDKPRLSKEMLGRQLTKYCSYIISQGGAKRIWKNAVISLNWQTLEEMTQKVLINDSTDTIKNII